MADSNNEPPEAGAGTGAAEEVDKKKNKKKKKPAAAAGAKDGTGATGSKSGGAGAGAKKKGPSAKALEALKESIRLQREEEERFQREQEEKDRILEEAENARLEKLRLEKERKEKKKQKEKEKKERLKAEGKLLTAKQKADRQRAQAMLEDLKARGVEVPGAGAGAADTAERKVKLGTRIRPKKGAASGAPGGPGGGGSSAQRQESTESIGSGSGDGAIEAQSQKEKEAAAAAEAQKIKDAWDQDSEGEEEKEDKSTGATGPVKQPSIESDVGNGNGLSRQSSSHSASSSGAGGGSGENEDDGSGSSDDNSEDDEDEDGEDPEGSEDDEDDYKHHKSDAEKKREKAIKRIQKRKEENEKARSLSNLRCPVVCVLGHVDTGKTKILDKLRRTHVQDGEAGGITQQIGATNVPIDAIRDQAKLVKGFADFDLKLPGLLIIDTPGHESFSNLRNRGSSLCDIAILVVDIMHGLEPQTIESINLLKTRKTPFVVALNKIDRLYDWQATLGRKDVRDVIRSQPKNTQLEFEKRANEIIVQFAEQSLNASLFDVNPDPKSYISMVPTSAVTGEGMGNLMALICELAQTMLGKRLMWSAELQAIVLEVKALPGLGTTIDVILLNGKLREGDTIVVAGTDGPIVTQIRSLLTPQPMKELRVKNAYIEFKEISGAIGVKLAGKDLEKSIAGLPLLVANAPDEIEVLKDEVARELKSVLNSIHLQDRGVYVQASTLGSLEALLEFLKTSGIPYAGIRIGPVVKKDVMKASIMLEHDSQYAVILAFDVKIERDAQDLADSLGVRIFQADIIYHLFDRFMAYRDELKAKKRDEFKHIAIFPCKLKILPQFIFNTRDPIIVGVVVEGGVVREGTPLCVPNADFLEIGRVTTIEINHKTIDSARKGQEVCIKIEPIPGETPKLLGRHFQETDLIVSKITRESIDACKEYFRNDLQKSDWQLMVELKKMFQIM